MAFDGCNRTVNFALWWPRELSTAEQGGEGCKPPLLISNLWHWQPEHWVIAAPSCDLQPQSSTLLGRCVPASNLYPLGRASLHPANACDHSKSSQGLLWRFPDCDFLQCTLVQVYTLIQNWCTYELLPCLAQPVCEPDWRGVPDHWEDHQPDRSEDFGSAGKRLWPYLFHHQQQTREGQVNVCSSVRVIAKVNLPDVRVRGGIFEQIYIIMCARRRQKAAGYYLPKKCDIKTRFHLSARRVDSSYNKSARLHSFLYGALGIVLPTLFILSFIVNTFSKEQLAELLGERPTRFVSILAVSPESHTGDIRTSEIFNQYSTQNICCSLSVFSTCVTGNSDIFMGLDTRRWTGFVCDHFWGFLLPPAFPIKTFCQVSVTENTNLKQWILNYLVDKQKFHPTFLTIY